MKFLKPEHMSYLYQSCTDIDGMIMLAEKISDADAKASIILKLEAAKAKLQAEYAEVEQPDGSLIVSHPAFGLVYVEEAILDEPTRLFFAKSKSLSSVKLSVFGADARVWPNGNVTYRRREKLIEVEMTQEAFACVISESTGQRHPATLREYDGERIEFEGDASERSSAMMLESAQNITDGLQRWGDEILAAAIKRADKGGVLSKTSRSDLLDTADTLKKWMGANPRFYAKELAKHVSSVANAVKMEVMSASRIQEKK